MEEYFYLKENSLSGAVPTEIGALAKMKEYLYFYSNELCDDVPTEVAALSSQFTTGFNLATGNSFGTPCFLLTDQSPYPPGGPHRSQHHCGHHTFAWTEEKVVGDDASGHSCENCGWDARAATTVLEMQNKRRAWRVLP